MELCTPWGLTLLRAAPIVGANQLRMLPESGGYGLQFRVVLLAAHGARRRSKLVWKVPAVGANGRSLDIFGLWHGGRGRTSIGIGLRAEGRSRWSSTPAAFEDYLRSRSQMVVNVCHPRRSWFVSRRWRSARSVRVRWVTRGPRWTESDSGQATYHPNSYSIHKGSRLV